MNMCRKPNMEIYLLHRLHGLPRHMQQRGPPRHFRAAPRGTCYDFWNTGRCRKGKDLCKFTHTPKPGHEDSKVGNPVASSLSRVSSVRGLEAARELTPFWQLEAARELTPFWQLDARLGTLLALPATAQRPGMDSQMLVRWNDWLHALIRSKLAQECINDKLTQCISLRENTQVLQAACKRMLKKFCQAETDEDEPVPAPAGPFGSHSKVEDWYDIVFAPVPTDQKGFAMLSLRKEQRKWIECNLLSHRREIELSEGDATVSEELAAHLFRPTSTIYGQGTDAALLSLQSLSATAPADNGQVVVCVAVAFRFNTLTGAPPFRVGKANSTNKDAANIKAWQQQAAGFDCVKYQQGSEEARTSATRRVYWTPGTVLPLHFLSMKLHVDCGICFEYCQRQQSVSCSKEHSVCQDCFTRVLEAAGAPNTLRRYLDERANVRCPADKCTEVFTLQQLANRLDKPQFEKLLNIQKVAHEQSVLPAALAAERKKMRAEFERIQAICDQDEREAARMRLDIIENVLVLKCPRCSAAFLDFSGCFALTCSRANCQAGFCAWCLQDCGNNNAHSHVASCPENKSARGRDVFGTQEAFDRHHEERRAREVRKRLAKASPAVTTYNISEKKKIISAMELMI